MSLNVLNPIAEKAPTGDRPVSGLPAAYEAVASAAHVSDAERIKADGLVQPASVAGITSTEDPALPMSERIKADGLVQPASVAGITSTEDPALPMSERIKADGLVQPASVAGITNTYDPSLTVAERYRADGL